MPTMPLRQLRIEHSHFAPHIKPLADSIGAFAPPQDNKTTKKGDDASQNRSAETRTHSDLHCSRHRWLSEESTCPYARGARQHPRAPLFGLVGALRQFAGRDFRELDRQQVLMAWVRDLNLPVSPILAIAIAFKQALTSKRECLVKSRREVGQREPLGVCIKDTSLRSDVERVKGSIIRQR